MRAVAPDADAAAHGEAVQKGDDGFGEVENACVHPVFVAPEARAVVVFAARPGGVHRGDIAARTEGPSGRGVNQNQMHVVVHSPGFQCFFDFETHVPGQCVHDVGPVQRDAARTAFGADQDVGHCSASNSAYFRAIRSPGGTGAPMPVPPLMVSTPFFSQVQTVH